VARPGGSMLNTEQAEVLGLFMDMLKGPTGDGAVKRERGDKPCWKIDTTHEAAIFSHLNKWKHGEKHDATSGAHPLVHLAWRALAIAWQESQEAHKDWTMDQRGNLHTTPPTISMDADDIHDALRAISEAGLVGSALARERVTRARNRILD